VAFPQPPAGGPVPQWQAQPGYPPPPGHHWPQQGHPAAPSGGPPQQGYPPPGYAPPPPVPGYPSGHTPGQPPWGPQAQSGHPPSAAQGPATQTEPATQRYGAPGSTYGGFGAFGAAAKPKRSKKPWLIGAAVIVVLGGGAAAAWLLGAFRGEVLDQHSVQDGVQKVLREDFGEGDVKDANCPKDQPVRTGTTFDCIVTVAGQPKKVTVRVLNDQAQYEVGAPK
jgi:hypothetical protein